MMRRYVLAAAALHGAILLLVLLPPSTQAPAAPEPPLIEVELVREGAETAGAPDTAAAPSPEAPSEPPDAAGPAQPRPATPPSNAPSAPAVNLGDGAVDRAALVVTGTGIVPPRPDAAHRNLPPAYPADAARRGRQGSVGLLVHVTEHGLPGAVQVIRGSGTPSLDRAARDAVLLWRFTPARIGGAPAAFSYNLDIRFRMGDE